MAFPYGPPADRSYWAAIMGDVQQLIADSFRNMPFAAPAFQLANRAIDPAQANQRWIPAPHSAMHTKYIPRHALHEGSEGVVNLWCLVDASNRILDKIAVKQVHAGAAIYDDARNWRNGVVGGVPREVEMANAIWTALPLWDRQHVVQCLGFGDVRGTGRWRYRSYSEYAGQNNLLGRIQAQNPRTKGLNKEGQQPFPEPFLWMLFEALAKTVLAMTQVGNGGVLHGDLQAQNIFFADNDPNRFAMYPVPKVADFGSTRELNSPAVQNRTNLILNDGCHRYFQPPELSRDFDQTGWEMQNAPPISNKTNVWQIGMLMVCCMKLRPFLHEMNWRGIRRNKWKVPRAQQLRFEGAGLRELPRDKIYHGKTHYSSELIDLVERCIRFNPADRPTPVVLLNDFQLHMQGKLQGTDTYQPTNGVIRSNMKKYKLRRHNDDNKYRVGKLLRGAK